MKLTKNRIRALLVMFLLVGPLIFYLVVRNTGNIHYLPLPYLGEREYDEKLKDTVYYSIPDFSFVDQDNKPFSTADANGKILVVNYFFATCKDVCPRMNGMLAKIYPKFQDVSSVQFMSISVDPEHDSPQVLNEYAKKFGAKSVSWKFLNGSKDMLLKTGLGMLLPVSESDSTLDHSQQIILIDKERHIRGVYNGLTKDGIDQLEKEIKVLLGIYKQNAEEGVH